MSKMKKICKMRITLDTDKKRLVNLKIYQQKLFTMKYTEIKKEAKMNQSINGVLKQSQAV